jgi:hypothetical protein
MASSIDVAKSGSWFLLVPVINFIIKCNEIQWDMQIIGKIFSIKYSMEDGGGF